MERERKNRRENNQEEVKVWVWGIKFSSTNYGWFFLFEAVSGRLCCSGQLKQFKGEKITKGNHGKSFWNLIIANYLPETNAPLKQNYITMSTSSKA